MFLQLLKERSQNKFTVFFVRKKPAVKNYRLKISVDKFTKVRKKEITMVGLNEHPETLRKLLTPGDPGC